MSSHRVRPGWALVVAGLGSLAGCAVTRSGFLADAARGRTIPISIVVRSDSAEITGVDPASGEKLAGKLLLDEESPRPGGDFGGVTPPVGGGPAGGPGGTAPIAVGRSASPAFALTGTLEGDQGTRLRCIVEVQQRLRLSGEGVCRSIRPESDARYVLRF